MCCCCWITFKKKKSMPASLRITQKRMHQFLDSTVLSKSQVAALHRKVVGSSPSSSSSTKPRSRKAQVRELKKCTTSAIVRGLSNTHKRRLRRPSPVEHAASFRGRTRIGLDGRRYTSVAGRTGVYQWRVIKG